MFTPINLCDYYYIIRNELCKKYFSVLQFNKL
ncbi:hypothetical protein ACQ27_gp449 [Klebsiella phage K64-1]|nr:hypothetical protein ACQ27_gp449 [Klebsiella phage K64-1]